MCPPCVVPISHSSPYAASYKFFRKTIQLTICRATFKYICLLYFLKKVSEEDEGEHSTAFKTKPTKAVKAKAMTKVMICLTIEDIATTHFLCRFSVMLT